MTSITRAYQFSASHRLHLANLTEQENEDLYGKCNNPFGHGHNYRLEVSVAGPVHQLTGQLLPLDRLDRLVHEKVISVLDHRYLNAELEEFSSLVPTTENVVVVIADILKKHWNAYIPEHAQLYRLHVQETDRNGFEQYYPVLPPGRPTTTAS